MDPTAARIVIAPNASLSGRAALGFLALTGAMLAVVSGVCAVMGFWPVIPFAGLELVALGAALWVTQKHCAYREVLDFQPERVVIEIGSLGRGVGSRMELSRYWTRATLEPGRRNSEPSRLVLSCAGQRVQLARCLTDEEREDLYARVGQLLRLPTVGHDTVGYRARLNAD